MLHHAMEVLDLFTVHRREIGVVAAAELLGRPKSTVSRWLSAMEDAGFLERDTTSGRYRVSLRMAAIGEAASQASPLQQVAYPFLQEITRVTGETSNLVLLTDREGMNVEAVKSARSVAHVGDIGRRYPLHASAAGKALLAWRPEEEVRALIEKPLRPRTEHTITEAAMLLAELAQVRRDGYAVNWREFEEDLASVGAPVRNHRAEVVAAVSISAPAWRLPREALPAIGAQVVEVAERLSWSLGYRTPVPFAEAVGAGR